MSEVSIIVPIYNAELFLHRCVDSILNQSFIDFDLILVDDGSQDQSALICDEYEQRDSRIHVIHQKNKGPSVARNNGIEYALTQSNSKYLTFVDSDDWIHPQYLEYMLKAITDYSAEISMCQHEYISKNKKLQKADLYNKCTFNEISAEELMVAQSNGFNYIWGKVYSKCCFKTLRYPENISFGEDNLVIFKIIFECKKIVFLDNVLYYYFYTPTGITKSLWSPKSLDVFEGIKVQMDYYAKHNYSKAYQKEVELYIQQCAYQIHRIRENNVAYRENRIYIQNMRKQMKQLFKENEYYQVYDRFYWLEALYPKSAKILNIMGRIKRSIIKIFAK